MGGIKNIVSAVKNKGMYAVWNTLNFTILKFSHCKTGHGIRTRGRIRVLNRGRIEIGDDSLINSSVMANPLGGSPCTILAALSGAEIIIGRHTGISNCAIFARKSVRIGNNVMIGAGVKIYDNDFHPVDFQQRMNNEPPKCASIEIKDGAFIGAHSLILKGVTIGHNSVVGAGSVVTKSIPDHQIWAGNPARFIRATDDKGENI